MQAKVNETIYIGYLETAFGHFNQALFDGELPPVVITMIRKKNSAGYFHAEQWSAKSGEKLHQINMSPNCFDDSLKEVLSTLAHEQAHLWQEVYGKPSRNGYHNKEWAAKMHAIGLAPDNGKGGETGQRVSHNIKKDGPFDRAADALIQAQGWDAMPLYSGLQKSKSKNSRAKYTCPVCLASVWGKPGLGIRCGCAASDADFVQVQ